MGQGKHEFVQFCIQHEVLRFGGFTLKSGLASPYFFDVGLFNTGRALTRLGRFYSETIRDRYAGQYDMLFGPACKG